MPEPGVPGESDGLELPCGETVEPTDFDLGMREFRCSCGETHAIVTDVHPLARFVPEFLVDTLRETVTTEDDFEEFGMPHAMAMVGEEFPEKVASADCSTEGSVGYSLVWVTSFDSRRLHGVVVELLLELMDHAISHADDDTIAAEFEQYMAEFDLETFVDLYRDEREFESEHDSAV
ncbi:DUF5815 family protein [Halovenus salina]|uniref:DUF5815 family protein n=1 Tax=Halovenus salina TaxID=1510225 RepID=A0ABD5VZ40_9EURY|nr:DUF5815 family protein [Halovenus salina]